MDYKRLIRVTDATNGGVDVKEHIEIDGTEVEVTKPLYYYDMEYCDKGNGDFVGDMGFDAWEQKDTRNDKSFEDNVVDIKAWAQTIIDNGDAEEDIPILYLCQGMFTDWIDGDEQLDMNTAKRLAVERFNMSSAIEDGRGKVVYALAVCSADDGNRYGIAEMVNKHFGIDVEYYAG